jgi:hypothetical protein
VIALHKANRPAKLRESAVDLLCSKFDMAPMEVISWIKKDPDLDPIRDHPRFKAMLAAAEVRQATSDPGPR